MADRQTRNVSVPAAQEQFIDSLVGSGRYRTASEVVREGLRLLEEREHARLLEKALYGELSDEERAQLPVELIEKARAQIQRLVSEGIQDRDAGRVSDGPTAMERIRKSISARRTA
ncbi:type II toxin-antitoxin system ParD family antitoxin [Gemmatimonas aurantiaca]|uniref:type II toxin-antitoxin system ParD family antitoxin n=1 Tax=Gemmatimonas aurantiaca TaxID=173480 RepID=UPI00301E13FD